MNYATYSPEDNKLRLYVGRVPRDEYEALRAEGWTSTPKQGCDFVATWTPERRDRALSYSEVIEDEDQSPEDRAADRAERFSGYRDKREGEATGHADRYDAGPSAHGFQNASKAGRSAARHDRIADRATDAWSKAEYWQQRTAGVIAHALYASRPDVRMGRILELEADFRRLSKREDEHGKQWAAHIALRLAYENQMLEAQGGRLASVEIEAGGMIGGKLIVKVNKSSVTGRVTSVDLKGPQVYGWTYKARNVPGTEYALYQFDTERMPMSAYTAPTDESRAELLALKKTAKAAAPKKAPCPLVNPTDADAERLQSLWNAAALAEREAGYKRMGYSLPVTDCEPQTVLRITQAAYSAHSQGTYARAGTRCVFRGGVEAENYITGAEKQRKALGFPVCQVRRTSGGNYSASRIVVLTDKPQKPLPVAAWEAIETSATLATV